MAVALGQEVVGVVEGSEAALRSRSLPEKSVGPYLGQVGRLRAGACSPAVRSTRGR